MDVTGLGLVPTLSEAVLGELLVLTGVGSLGYIGPQPGISV
jgi:hypothetical protein